MGVELGRKPFRNSYLQNLRAKQSIYDTEFGVCFKFTNASIDIVHKSQFESINKDLLGIIVNGSPNSLVKKS